MKALIVILVFFVGIIYCVDKESKKIELLSEVPEPKTIGYDSALKNLVEILQENGDKFVEEELEPFKEYAEKNIPLNNHYKKLSIYLQRIQLKNQELNTSLRTLTDVGLAKLNRIVHKYNEKVNEKRKEERESWINKCILKVNFQTLLTKIESALLVYQKNKASLTLDDLSTKIDNIFIAFHKHVVKEIKQQDVESIKNWNYFFVKEYEKKLEEMISNIDFSNMDDHNSQSTINSKLTISINNEIEKVKIDINSYIKKQDELKHQEKETEFKPMAGPSVVTGTQSDTDQFNKPLDMITFSDIFLKDVRRDALVSSFKLKYGIQWIETRKPLVNYKTQVILEAAKNELKKTMNTVNTILYEIEKLNFRPGMTTKDIDLGKLKENYQYFSYIVGSKILTEKSKLNEAQSKIGKLI